jgi:hypothetical protein
VEPATGLAAVPPDTFVKVKGVDVGVALFASTGVESRDCLMGHRADGAVKVWALSWDDKEGELCDAETALATP